MRSRFIESDRIISKWTFENPFMMQGNERMVAWSKNSLCQEMHFLRVFCYLYSFLLGLLVLFLYKLWRTFELTWSNILTTCKLWSSSLSTCTCVALPICFRRTKCGIRPSKEKRFVLLMLLPYGPEVITDISGLPFITILIRVSFHASVFRSTSIQDIKRVWVSLTINWKHSKHSLNELAWAPLRKPSP